MGEEDLTYVVSDDEPFLADLDSVSGQPAAVQGWQFGRFGWWGGAPRSEIAPSAGR